MENVGSLNSFLEQYSSFCISRPATSFKTCATAATAPFNRKSLADRLDLKSRLYGIKQVDSRETGFCYKTPSRAALTIQNISKKSIASKITRPQSSAQNYSKSKSKSIHKTNDKNTRSTRPKSQDFYHEEKITLQELSYCK